MQTISSEVDKKDRVEPFREITEGFNQFREYSVSEETVKISRVFWKKSNRRVVM